MNQHDIVGSWVASLNLSFRASGILRLDLDQNWVDYFPGIAEQFHVDISPVTAWWQDPNNDSATDFAVGGSTSGNLNVINAVLPNPVLPSFPDQITAYVKSLGSKADDLCVIWIGANDFPGIEPLETVANIKGQIAKLSAAGAKNFFVITIPDLALTPKVKALPGATILAATQFVVTTNVLLAVELPRFAFAHQIRIDLVDISAIFVPVVYQPARFGFTNSTNFAYEPPNGPLLVIKGVQGVSFCSRRYSNGLMQCLKLWSVGN